MKVRFPFFRWIFIPKDIEDRDEMESIIIHESVHVTQHHSADNLLIGFTAALMWFNPLVWMMKKSFHLIHEYLADEGTIGSGIDRLRYQAFLINHVAEERVHPGSSGFNQSLIKKRMIMMTRDKNKLQKKGRILVMIPLSLILISTTGFINGMFPGEPTRVPVPEYNYIRTSCHSSRCSGIPAGHHCEENSESKKGRPKEQRCKRKDRDPGCRI